MRRFEFVEGSSSKFWEPELKGNTFIVTFGRIGTAGQRREKAFADEAGARKEYEKKVAEKLREGYLEVTEGGAAEAAPASAPPPAPKKAELPRRVPAVTPTSESLKAAAEALAALRARLGWRSWEVTSRARRAKRALRALGGVDPAAHSELAGTFTALMERVVAPKKDGRLPLRHALALLGELDVAAFTRAAEVWLAVPDAVPAATTVARQASALGQPELALRMGMLLAERPGLAGAPSEEGWSKRWTRLRPHVEEQLSSSGGSLATWAQSVDASKDAHLASRLARLEA
ncbi:WGR domain-containing protein [Myxococcus xanthus]|uniref:WGR domain-containing protein n=1 Tax=Myxococcus xanthus TaxID=34 RepID=A0A7Y4IP79_MYXXA|nr:WGR domain-containing protein [Myxococcus xanthus]NOJ82884.1 WGR domain-containing protein [Myxococcus xanthus]NOJ87738.1 WGR domain-containing protein [Myxococcus xanthus]